MGERKRKKENWKKEFIELIKPPIIITSYGSISKLEYRNESNQRHKAFGPAIIRYDENGRIYCEEYWVNDQQHRPTEEGPAYITYDTSGIRGEVYRINGKIHKPEEGPAWIHYRTNGQPQLVCDSIVDGKLISFKFY